MQYQAFGCLAAANPNLMTAKFRIPHNMNFGEIQNAWQTGLIYLNAVPKALKSPKGPYVPASRATYAACTIRPTVIPIWYVSAFYFDLSQTKGPTLLVGRLPPPTRYQF